MPIPRARAVLAADADVNQVRHLDLADHVSDIRDQLCSCAALPDAELISACREYLGCDRIASEMRADRIDPWKEGPAFRAQSDRLSDAIKEQNRLLPLVLDTPAKTREGVAMKARVIERASRTKIGCAARPSVPQRMTSLR